MTWLIDLDGVVWRGKSLIAGSDEALHRLREAATGYAFVTNNSALAADGYVDKLRSFGIQLGAHQIIHGGHAVARLTQPGQRVLVCAGAGVAEALTERGIDHVSGLENLYAAGPFDAVIVGWLPDFSYDLLSTAVRAVLEGAALLAPSGDPLYPSEDGPKMGGGSLTMAVAYATGADPQFAAKPFPAMVETVRDRFPDASVMVGDQPWTDGGLAAALDIPFLRVTSGVASKDPRGSEVPVHAEVPDLAAAVSFMLTGS